MRSRKRIDMKKGRILGSGAHFPVTVFPQEKHISTLRSVFGVFVLNAVRQMRYQFLFMLRIGIKA